jgi:hypothetical protein
MVEQKSEGLVNQWRFNDVVIIENEREFSRKSGNLVDEGGHQGLSGWRAGCSEHAQRHFAKTWINSLEGGEEIGQESGKIIVAFVK